MEAGGNCGGGKAWVANILVCGAGGCCCCCGGNLGETFTDVWGALEKGVLPNIELLNPDEDVEWPSSRNIDFLSFTNDEEDLLPPLAVFPKIDGSWSCMVFWEVNNPARAAYLST